GNVVLNGHGVGTLRPQVIDKRFEARKAAGGDDHGGAGTGDDTGEPGAQPRRGAGDDYRLFVEAESLRRVSGRCHRMGSVRPVLLPQPGGFEGLAPVVPGAKVSDAAVLDSHGVGPEELDGLTC